MKRVVITYLTKDKGHPILRSDRFITSTEEANAIWKAAQDQNVIVRISDSWPVKTAFTVLVEIEQHERAYGKQTGSRLIPLSNTEGQ